MKVQFQIGGNKMNSIELARKIIDCISDGYDDEENREEAETELYNELSQLDGNSVVKAVLLRLCETIEELTE
jgi:hypothetical protein